MVRIDLKHWLKVRLEKRFLKQHVLTKLCEKGWRNLKRFIRKFFGRFYKSLRSKYSVIITVCRIYESLRSKYSVIITVSLFSHLFLRLFFKLCDYNFFVKYVLNVYSI